MSVKFLTNEKSCDNSLSHESFSSISKTIANAHGPARFAVINSTCTGDENMRIAAARAFSLPGFDYVKTPFYLHFEP